RGQSAAHGQEGRPENVHEFFGVRGWPQDRERQSAPGAASRVAGRARYSRDDPAHKTRPLGLPEIEGISWRLASALGATAVRRFILGFFVWQRLRNSSPPAAARLPSRAFE